MFQNISQTYTMQDASIEIMIMLSWAFILWMLMGWLLKKAKIVQVEDSWTPKKNIKKPKDKDNLQIIEGIGPKIEKLLYTNGIEKYEDIVEQDVSWLELILLGAGKKFSIHNPSTWPDQARLAMKGKWSELEEYQDILGSNKKKK